MCKRSVLLVRRRSGGFLGLSYKSVPQEYLASVPQECPAVSHTSGVLTKSVLHECPTRVSPKNAPQECLTSVSCMSVPQECPTVSHASAILSKSVLQDCPTRVSPRIPHKGVSQECHARVSYKSVMQECPSLQVCLARLSHNTVLQHYPRKRVVHESTTGPTGIS